MPQNIVITISIPVPNPCAAANVTDIEDYATAVARDIKDRTECAPRVRQAFGDTEVKASVETVTVIA